MQTKNTLVAAVIGIGLLAANQPALGHGTTPMAIQMKKLHTMMPMFSTASAGLEAALDKRDLAAVEAEAGKILAAVPDLKRSKPHKHSAQHKKFTSIANDLERAVDSTVSLAKKGDYEGAKKAFGEAEKTCAACHENFRD